ncbi:hypothetical protein L249_6457 [Ophiocordyceps polyrhachis-furcata BCC 54312]|uniref:Uncharacterized protein n=1 Tax=Ophiocordyceps polyrhachis-furcata BCC 54312 TaxID=1330021 RepID=A0A367LJY0_9HYPO|nr:hypothetical protein L249_6457 [Ophiocordyceps polyrhachis-furcata BCC 54312]
MTLGVGIQRTRLFKSAWDHGLDFTSPQAKPSFRRAGCCSSHRNNLFVPRSLHRYRDGGKYTVMFEVIAE